MGGMELMPKILESGEKDNTEDNHWDSAGQKMKNDIGW